MLFKLEFFYSFSLYSRSLPITTFYLLVHFLAIFEEYVWPTVEPKKWRASEEQQTPKKWLISKTQFIINFTSAISSLKLSSTYQLNSKLNTNSPKPFLSNWKVANGTRKQEVTKSWICFNKKMECGILERRCEQFGCGTQIINGQGWRGPTVVFNWFVLWRAEVRI